MAWWSRGQNAAKYHGLVNQGATCYLNSVLQVLFMTEEFRETVKSHSNNEAEFIDRELRELFTILEKNYAHTHKITKKLKITNVYEQRDAAEHFEKILRLTSPEASQIFHGELMNWNTCKTCQTKSGIEAAFWSLPLPLVNSNNYYSVEKGIADFFRPSEITGDNQMYCDDCDRKRDAVLHCEVSHQPDVLVLLLKRFEFDYSYMTYVKINQPVDVPYTVQIPGHHDQNQSYNLYAFVEHFGELRHGHYTSTVWAQEDDTWYIFNDSHVGQLKTSPKLKRSKSAYLLFYRKQLKEENEDVSVRAPRKRSCEQNKQEDKPVELKKPKQEPSAEEQPLHQTGRRSPDNQDLDVGESQETYNTADPNQDCRADIGESVEWDRPDQVESEAFCTEDRGRSNIETQVSAEGGEQSEGEQFKTGGNDVIDLKNEEASTVEVQGVQGERQEQRGRLAIAAAFSGTGSYSEEEAAKATENNFGERFQRQEDKRHQTFNPQVANANQMMESRESCVDDTEFSDHSVTADKLDCEQPSRVPPNQHSKWDGSDQLEDNTFCTEDVGSSNSETQVNAEVGEQFNTGGNDGIDLRNEEALTVEVRGGQGERQEQRGRLAIAAAFSGMGRNSEEEAANATEDDFGERFQKQEDKRVQTFSPQVANATQMMESRESCVDDAKFSDQSVIADKLELKPQCVLECVQPSRFSPNQHSAFNNKCDESDQLEYNAFCTEDVGRSTSETQVSAEGGEQGEGGQFNAGALIDLRNEGALTVEVRGSQGERQEQRGRLAIAATFFGTGRYSEEKAANATKGDFGERFQRQEDKRHQTFNPKVANVNQMMESRESCVDDTEFSDHSVTADKLQLKPQSVLDCEQPNQCSPNQHSAINNKCDGSDQSEYNAFCTEDVGKSNGETLVNAEGGEQGEGEQFNAGANQEEEAAKATGSGQSEYNAFYAEDPKCANSEALVKEGKGKDGACLIEFNRGVSDRRSEHASHGPSPGREGDAADHKSKTKKNTNYSPQNESSKIHRYGSKNPQAEIMLCSSDEEEHNMTLNTQETRECRTDTEVESNRLKTKKKRFWKKWFGCIPLKRKRSK